MVTISHRQPEATISLTDKISQLEKKTQAGINHLTNNQFQTALTKLNQAYRECCNIKEQHPDNQRLDNLLSNTYLHLNKVKNGLDEGNSDDENF